MSTNKSHFSEEPPYVAQTADQVPVILKRYGVVVLPNVFSAAECDAWMEQIVGSVECLSSQRASKRSHTQDVKFSSSSLDLKHNRKKKGNANGKQTTKNSSNKRKSGKGVSRHNTKSTWIPQNLPPHGRFGLFKSLLNNLQPVWEIRRDPRLLEIFRKVYGSLREERNSYSYTTDGARETMMGGLDSFICSPDGVNLQPNQMPDGFGNIPDKDWAHVDSTNRRNPFQCVQGQVVLTNTTAAFRCTPGSHLMFDEVLDACYIPRNEGASSKHPARNWLKFRTEQLSELQKIVYKSPGSFSGNCFSDAGCNEELETIENIEQWWQIPIQASRGSIILWFPSTIHSAASVVRTLEPTPSDPWRGWRGVVYVCLRPKCDFSENEMQRLESCMTENNGTNHWGTHVVNAAGERNHQTQYNAAIEDLIEDSTRVYDVLGWKPGNREFEINCAQKQIAPEE